MVSRGETEQRAHPSPGIVGEGAPSGEREGFGPDRVEVVFVERFADPTSVEGARLLSSPESVATARRLTASVLDSWGLGRLLDPAERMVAELATNAVKHTGSRYFGLHLTRRGGWLRVEIRDGSRALPCLITGDPGEPVGGLALVEELSDRWGADLLPRGKGVWFEFKLR
jgi:hypothetical protein